MAKDLQCHELESVLRVAVVEWGLSASAEIWTLTALAAGPPPVTVGMLHGFTGLPKSSISRYVAGWITRGWVREVIDPADRRLRVLALSVEGERLVETLLAAAGNPPPIDGAPTRAAATLGVRAR